MNKRKILLRFDDICSTMNWEQWERAKKKMDEAGVTALLGVVPDNKDPDIIIDEPNVYFWEYIKGLQEHGHAIAMHGFHHQFEIDADGIVTKKKRSEFAGLPYDAQLEKIRKGKEILNKHGIETEVFFAPAHSYDDNTLKALYASGFKYVSDGLSNKPYKRHGITLLPCRSGGIPRISKCKGYVTAVIHAHEWVRKESEIEKRRFTDLLENHKDEIISFNEFKQQVCGINWYQRIVEHFFLIAKIHIAPRLIRIICLKSRHNHM